MHSPGLAYINKTGNGEGNRDGEWNFCPGKEADVALIASDKNKKDRKNLWSKLVDYSLNRPDDHKQQTFKPINKPKGLK